MLDLFKTKKLLKKRAKIEERRIYIDRIKEIENDLRKEYKLKHERLKNEKEDAVNFYERKLKNIEEIRHQELNTMREDHRNEIKKLKSDIKHRLEQKDIDSHKVEEEKINYYEKRLQKERHNHKKEIEDIHMKADELITRTKETFAKEKMAYEDTYLSKNKEVEHRAESIRQKERIWHNGIEDIKNMLMRLKSKLTVNSNLSGDFAKEFAGFRSRFDQELEYVERDLNDVNRLEDKMKGSKVNLILPQYDASGKVR